MTLDRGTISRILGIVLTAVVALLAVFGYDVAVIQPRAAGPVLELPAAAAGDSNFTNVVTSGYVTTGGALTVGGAADIAGTLNYGTSNLYPVGSSTSGLKQVCSSTTITGTGTLAHGLATPSAVQLSLAQDATGNCVHLSHTNASATVTAKCWNSALTPAAATTPVAVNWCVLGSP